MFNHTINRQKNTEELCKLCRFGENKPIYTSENYIKV